MNQIALTIDVEWAHPVVLDSLVQELNARNLRATFFCTHAGICVGGHERAIHPNYRRFGNSTIRDADILTSYEDTAFYEEITLRTKAFCPEAVGVRAHNLFWDSALASIYRNAGVKYVSNAFLPLNQSLQPVSRARGLLELPVYYMDYWDVTEQATGLNLGRLRLGSGGLQVLDFHPNLIFINAQSAEHYEESKKHYHEPERLLSLRASGRGVRTLFLEVLDYLAAQPEAPRVLEEIEAQWPNLVSA
jgi:hypothetical protein